MPRRIRFTRSARRHRIGHAHVEHVVNHAGMRFPYPPPASAPPSAATRYLYVGDDDRGRPLEVFALDQADGSLLVIHAMDLRPKYTQRYQEAKRWVR
jgi:hypothetical protein